MDEPCSLCVERRGGQPHVCAGLDTTLSIIDEDNFAFSCSSWFAGKSECLFAKSKTAPSKLRSLKCNLWTAGYELLSSRLALLCGKNSQHAAALPAASASGNFHLAFHASAVASRQGLAHPTRFKIQRPF